MNKNLAIAIISALFSVTSFPALAKTPQQEKMVSCNQEASTKTLKGDERKVFMKSCLSAEPEVAAPKSTMAACNKASAGKKGDERKTFMSGCLKAKGPENMK